MVTFHREICSFVHIWLLVKSLVNYRRPTGKELKPRSTAEAPEGNSPGCAAPQASDHIRLVAFQLSTLCTHTHTHTLRACSAFAFYPVWLSQGKMDAKSVFKPSSKSSNDTTAVIRSALATVVARATPVRRRQDSKVRFSSGTSFNLLGVVSGLF